jgi:hypothetical protein
VPAKSTSKTLATTQGDIEARLHQLVAAVNAGNESAATELHEFCRSVPALWDRLGGLEHKALASWKQVLAPGTTNSAAFSRDHIDSELSRRREALHADGASQLETLLINRILSAWLQVMYADAAYAQMQQRDGSLVQMEYAQKRLDRAQRQLLRAIQALATTRRVLRPAQINIIAQNQINVVQ